MFGMRFCYRVVIVDCSMSSASAVTVECVSCHVSCFISG